MYEVFNMGHRMELYVPKEIAEDIITIWDEMKETSIEGSTASNRLRFYTNSTLSLTLDSSQNATFAGNVTAPGHRSRGRFKRFRW